jgi:hypothetical protein
MSIDTFLSLWLVCHRQCVWLHGKMILFQDRKRTSERTEAKMRPWPTRKRFCHRTPCSRLFPKSERSLKPQERYFGASDNLRQHMVIAIYFTVSRISTRQQQSRLLIAAQPHHNHLISITLHLGSPWQNALPMNLTIHCCLLSICSDRTIGQVFTKR